jgi:hypothetical protein
MSMLSSVALAPSVGHKDARLLSLGAQLEAAAAEEDSVCEESDRRLDKPEIQDLEFTLSFLGDTIDRRLRPFLSRNNWSDGAIFAPRDAEDLRALPAPFHDEILQSRLCALIEANDAYQALLLEIDRRIDAAHDKTAAIVALIENEQAQTVEGLTVKVMALRWCRTVSLDDEELSEAAQADMRIYQSMLRDLAAIAAAA